MSFFRKDPVIAVHSTRFHADDLFAAAMMLEYLGGKAKVIRSIDPKVLEKADYVLDIGREYDPARNRFDHHQGPVGERPNGVPFAASGLVWKHFGEAIAGDADVAAIIDDTFVAPIDAGDTGFASAKPLAEGTYPYVLDTMVRAFNSTWMEKGRDQDKVFASLLPFARKLLQREIAQAQAKVAARDFIQKAYDDASDKRLLVLNQVLPLDSLEDKKDVLFVVSPGDRGDWCVRTVRKTRREFENRKDLPSAWAGKGGDDMAKASGVSDATFCHLKLFLACARSREGAISLAEKALRSE